MSKTTLFQKTRLGKIQQWSIWVDPSGNSGHPEVWVEHGQVSGKKQQTHDIIAEGVNIGKANETTPLEQATLTMERIIIKKREKGYKDNVKELDKIPVIDFNKRLPKELCFYKPITDADFPKFKELEKNDNILYTVKRDGMMHVVRKTKTFGVEIYTRTMDLVTDKYPHLIGPLSKLPDNTILLGELTLNGFDSHLAAYKAISKICRSDPDKAIKRQEEFGNVIYYIFDVAFSHGTNVLISEKYEHRNSIAEGIVDICGSEFVTKTEIIAKSYKEAIKETSKRKLEGLVAWTADAKMADGEAFTFNGKPYRPEVLWKFKFADNKKLEDDFVVRFDPANGIGTYGKGKNNGKIKSAFVYQIQDGVEVHLGKCGGGLDDPQRDFYTTAEYPRVWKIEYDGVHPGTGHLRYAVFNADRTLTGDKSINECIINNKIKKAREV